VPVHTFSGLADENAPPSHADLYARAIAWAQMHRLPARDRVPRQLRWLKHAPEASIDLGDCQKKDRKCQ